MKYESWNIDIVIKTDKGKYLLEVDGEFYHGLIQLPNEHKYYDIMLERKAKHDKK